MTVTCSSHEGTSALLISIPHDGRRIPPPLVERMTAEGLAIPDTDWHVRRLYEFAKLSGASIVAAKYSRYVVDLNRSPDDEVLYEGRYATGLIPLRTFAGDDIYRAGAAPDDRDRRRRVKRYWRPYHAELEHVLERIRKQFGYAVLWDAHSIRGSVPLLFEGKLPVLSIGTNEGRSCPPEVEEAVTRIAAASDYSYVTNGRFKGGFITRHYGAPSKRVFTVQLEIAQRSYMDESSRRYDAGRAAALGRTLENMLTACQSSAAAVAQAAGVTVGP